MPRLVFKKGENSPVELAGPVVVGRSSEQANVAIKDGRLSRAHCRFEPRDGQWAVVDLGSQNGTFVNGRRVQESLIKPGDLITIGSVDMAIEDAPVLDGSDSTRTVVAPAALIQVKGNLKERLVPILGDEFTIGRRPGNMLVLEGDTKVSGSHARILRKPDGYVLEDLGSTNGVSVNGHRITEPVLLKIGQTIVIGNHTFQFMVHGKEVESSGASVPMSLKELTDARKSDSKSGVERGEELAQAMDEEAQIAAREAAAESKVADRAALTQDVKHTGGGGALIGAIEIVLVLALAAGVFYAAYMLMTEKRDGGAGAEGPARPARHGGLANAQNPSFDTLDNSGLPDGWDWDMRGGDQVSMTEASHGGPYALQLSRFSNQHSISYMVGPMTEAPASGIKVSVYAVNSEMSGGRTGTAVVSLFWYADMRDSKLQVMTPLVMRAGMRQWTLLEGSTATPPGAKGFRVALGISGKAGSVVYDDLVVEADASAKILLAAAESSATDGGLRWSISADGRISALQGDWPLLKDAQLVLHRREGAEDPLVLAEFLAAPLRVKVDGSDIEADYSIFDPVGEKPLDIKLRLGAAGTGLKIYAAPATSDNESKLYLGLLATATPHLVPAELVRLDGDLVQEYRNEIGMGSPRRKLALLIASDTGKGNRIEPGAGSPTISVMPAPGGREMFVQGLPVLDFSITLGGERDKLAELTAQIAGVQPGEDQVDRIARALTILRDFPFNQNEILSAAQALDSAAIHYKLRQLELNDGINVHELTRNENLYIAAMDESIRIAQRLRQQAVAWDEAQRGPVQYLQGVNMSARTHAAAALAAAALRSLAGASRDFDTLAHAARRARFLLAVTIEQRESETFLVSARDYLSSGLPTQGRLKLAYIVETYPRCLRGIMAKELMVEQAEALFKEAAEHEKQGLNHIARTQRARAVTYLDLAEAKLLRNVLDKDESLWLRGLKVDGDDASAWFEREENLFQRIRRLKTP